MRVLVDVSAVPGDPRGAGTYVVHLVRGLDKVPGVDLVVLARRDDATRWRSTATGSEVHALVPGPRPVRLAWEQARGPRVAADLGVDVWHGPHYTLPLRHLGVPAVVTVHDLTLLEHPEWHERAKVAFFRRMIPAAAKRAAVCVCVSGHTADRLRALVPAAADTVVIHHGIDHDRFRPDGDEQRDLAAVAALGIHPPYVAFVGTIEPRKNVPALVDAFSMVAATRPDLSLVIAGGTGWGGDAVPRAIERSGLADRVLRTGYVPGGLVAPLFRCAAAVAYPSLEEGFGLPALEALACGATVVTTRGSAMEEFVGDAAVFAESSDASGLGAALEEALSVTADPARRRRVAAQAAPYTWEASVDAHVEVYRRVAALRP